jgi:hypothetical protein
VVDATMAFEETGVDVAVGGDPPFKQEHALEILAGTLAHRAAIGCTV